MPDNISGPAPQVVTEILNGDALTLAAGARTLPPHRGESVAPSTLWRWHRKGVKTPDGRRVHLEMARVGGKWVTSRAALARFISASTPGIPTDNAPPPRSRTAKRRQSDAERAGRALEQIGA
jgi:hypothetical protein